MAETPQSLITEFKQKVEQWRTENPDIPIVFNEELEKLEFKGIELILVADNPGKQEAERKIYLVPDPTGPRRNSTAGKLAKDFFEYVQIPRERILILNKSPIHSPQTNGLKPVWQSHPALMEETQKYMADLTFRMHKAIDSLNPKVKVWITGFSDCWDSDEKRWKVLKGNGEYYAAIFPPFFHKLATLYAGDSEGLPNNLHILKHFSMHKIFEDFEDTNIRSLLAVKKALLPPKEVLRQLHCLEYANNLVEQARASWARQTSHT